MRARVWYLFKLGLVNTLPNNICLVRNGNKNESQVGSGIKKSFIRRRHQQQGGVFCTGPQCIPRMKENNSIWWATLLNLQWITELQRKTRKEAADLCYFFCSLIPLLRWGWLDRSHAYWFGDIGSKFISSLSWILFYLRMNMLIQCQ